MTKKTRSRRAKAHRPRSLRRPRGGASASGCSDVVRAPRPRPAVAADRRPVSHPRLGDHAAADAGRSRAAQIRGVARQVSVARGARRALTRQHVTDTWRPLGYNIRPRRLQAIAREAVERYDGRLPDRRGDAAVVQGHRPVHGWRDPQLRVPPACGDPRHQRRARALSRVRRQWRSEEPRDEETPLGGVGSARAAAAGVRLQPGAHGLRRHCLHGEKAEVSRLSDGEGLPGVADFRLLIADCRLNFRTADCRLNFRIAIEDCGLQIEDSLNSRINSSSAGGNSSSRSCSRATHCIS